MIAGGRRLVVGDVRLGVEATAVAEWARSMERRGADLAALDARCRVDLAVPLHEDTDALLISHAWSRVRKAGVGGRLRRGLVRRRWQAASAVAVADCAGGRVAVLVDVVGGGGWFAAGGEAALASLSRCSGSSTVSSLVRVGAVDDGLGGPGRSVAVSPAGSPVRGWRGVDVGRPGRLPESVGLGQRLDRLGDTRVVQASQALCDLNLITGRAMARASAFQLFEFGDRVAEPPARHGTTALPPSTDQRGQQLRQPPHGCWPVAST